MIKKSFVLLCMLIALLTFLSSFVIANKIEISTTKESFSSGENISLQINLYDEQNNLINDNVLIVLEDAKKTRTIEKIISSNKIVYVDIGENPIAGPWTINIKYTDPNTNEVSELTEFFNIEINEEVQFDIEGDILTVTNIGNTEYTRSIYITIGDTIGEPKKVDLDIEEKISFRLIAPDGTYNIRVYDGKKSVVKSGVTLTGKVVGILDEKIASGSTPITGGLRPGEESEDIYSGLKNKNFVYVFLIVIIGAGILLAIERNYRKKL